MNSPSDISNAVAVAAFGLLSLYAVYGLSRRVTGLALLLAAVATTLSFAAAVGYGAGLGHLVAVPASFTWIALLLRIIGVRRDALRQPDHRAQTALLGAAILAFVLVVAALALEMLLPALGGRAWRLSHLLVCVLGLVLVEQMLRNSRQDYQWNLKFMALGIGILFGFDFVMAADAALFNRAQPDLIAARGLIHALAVPFILVACVRNRTAPMNMAMSRRFLLRTGMLVACGIYLSLIAGAGYYLQFFGGDWGQVLLVLFVSIALIGLFVVGTSTQVRNYLRVMVSRHLFELKYDYREEWGHVTQAIAIDDPDRSLGVRAIGALADIVHSPAGAMWLVDEHGALVPDSQHLSSWNSRFSPADEQALLRYFHDDERIIDLVEYRSHPVRYPGLQLSEAVTGISDLRLVVPLFVGRDLYGQIFLAEPRVAFAPIWEDFDVLRLAARQIAAVISQQRAAQELASARQFQSFHQMSAFLVHDVKTTVAQLSLLVGNAQKHRHNPAFIDDMVRTVEHATRRMTDLLAQLRPNPGGNSREPVVTSLRPLVDAALARHAQRRPTPVLVEGDAGDAALAARLDPTQFALMLDNVLNNAQDATPPDGLIEVRLHATPPWARIEVRDTGSGMTPQFMADGLFKPFESTKGVRGMGVGVHETRRYLRSIGGDLEVTSAPAAGSTFVLVLPLHPRADNAPN